MQPIKIITIVVVAITMSACSLLRPAESTPTPAYHVVSQQQRVADLNRIQSWALQGSISIQQTTRTDLASLQWTQQHSQYHFALFGPLGFGQVGITGRPGAITLTRTDHPAVSAASPELLMQQQLGWQIPVSNLYYWARGLPAPGIPAKTEYDKYNHLIALQQQGWQINYSEYMPVAAVDLPKKMELSTRNLRIKLVVRSWSKGVKS